MSVDRELLAAWGLADAEVTPLGRGLINATFAVDPASGPRYVLQRVNPIFDRRIHHNLLAVTEHLARVGMTTPRLVPTRDDQLIHEREGVWRLLTRVDGVGFDALADARQARAAGRFVGRWHAALRDLDHAFVGLRVGVHDTARHLATLRAALEQHPSHRLFPSVETLGRELLDTAERLPALPALPDRIAHGDLKINNLMFAGEDPASEAIALIDLDTVGPMSLACELGDAWRSWCNLSTEDQHEARFDLELFAASLAGWLEGIGEAPSADERLGLLLGPEWISLELAVRFAADALAEGYFGWSPERFAGRGEHNLARAQGQWSLHRAIVANRSARSRLLGLT
ncbi:phosphotransferase enzyme family protein [Nannocystaceae bacterium ST9]